MTESYITSWQNPLDNKYTGNDFFYQTHNTSFIYLLWNDSFLIVVKQPCSSAVLSSHSPVVQEMSVSTQPAQIPSNSDPPSPSQKACQSSHFLYLGTHVVMDGWFVGNSPISARGLRSQENQHICCRFVMPNRVCASPHFHLLCLASSMQNFLMVLVIFTRFCCF